MENVYRLANNVIELSVKNTGAEMCSIKHLMNDREYMWNANPDIWAGHAPVLFPIIGALKNDYYFYEGEKYFMPRHGFVRGNKNIELISKTSNSLTFWLKYSSDTLKCFPFRFEFYINYTLDKNTIIVSHEVKNLDEKVMFFSLGGHPAFKCPIELNEKYSDYFLEFEQNETAYTCQIEPNGLIGQKTDLIFNNSRILNLHHKLFEKGALVFKNLQSRKVSLISKISGKCIAMNYDGFPYLGIWAKPNADFICIEPWQGIADSVDTNQKFETKEGIISLFGNTSFNACYTISIY
jgi:galactose mutarotase-like enzyme